MSVITIKKPSLNDFEKEIIPRTRAGYYEGLTIKDKYIDMQIKSNLWIAYNGKDIFAINELSDIIKEILSIVDMAKLRKIVIK